MSLLVLGSVLSLFRRANPHTWGSKAQPTDVRALTLKSWHLPLPVMLQPEGPQADALEPDLAAALADAPDARVFFTSLPTFYRKNFVRWILSAKQPQTRAARIAEWVRLLRAGQRER